jgi:hypothetical protein
MHGNSCDPTPGHANQNRGQSKVFANINVYFALTPVSMAPWRCACWTSSVPAMPRACGKRRTPQSCAEGTINAVGWGAGGGGEPSRGGWAGSVARSCLKGETVVQGSHRSDGANRDSKTWVSAQYFLILETITQVFGDR